MEAGYSPSVIPPLDSEPPKHRWAGTALVVAGLVIVAVETDNLLGLVGIVFVGIGGYALIHGWLIRRERTLASPL